VEKRAGMVAGLLRTLVISTHVTLFLLHTPLGFLVRDSMIGDLARVVQPIISPINLPRSTTSLSISHPLLRTPLDSVLNTVSSELNTCRW
jgi:hypothetical protein